MTTHAELVAAVEGLRANDKFMSHTYALLCEVLAAILSAHKPDVADVGVGTLTVCHACASTWPCLDIDIVVDALRKMGNG